MSRKNLIAGAERYLRRKLSDAEVQQLLHASDAFNFGDNDALWVIVAVLESNKWALEKTLASYQGDFAAIPAGIKLAADAQRQSAEAANKLALSQTSQQINEIVRSLIPTVQKEVSIAARSAMRRVHLGEGMFSLWAGTLIVSAVFLMGALLGSRTLQLISDTKNFEFFKSSFGWLLVWGLAGPPIIGLGVYAVEADYSSELKFLGWWLVLVPLVAFVLPALKVFGIWK
jgi:hypothetical protein